MSQQHRHEYAAGFPRGLPARQMKTSRKVPASKRNKKNSGTHCDRPRSARFRAGVKVEGRNNAGSSRTPLRHRSPGLRHLAVLTHPGFVRAASHPPRHHPDQTALSFVTLLRQDNGAGLSPPHELAAPRGAIIRLDNFRVAGTALRKVVMSIMLWLSVHVRSWRKDHLGRPQLDVSVDQSLPSATT